MFLYRFRKTDRDRKGRKMTSNVRRILGYNRNFGHYLADEEALITAGGSSTVAAPLPAASTPAQKDGRRRPEREAATPNANAGAMAPPPAKPAPLKQEDTQITSPTSSPKRSRSHQASSTPAPQPPPYPPEYDKDPLLRTRDLPSRPSDRVMAQLLAEPPLSYNAARAKPLDAEKQTPTRHFCVICGYWGRVRCRRCGERTCGGLECWKGHEGVGCGQGVS